MPLNQWYTCFYQNKVTGQTYEIVSTLTSLVRIGTLTEILNNETHERH